MDAEEIGAAKLGRALSATALYAVTFHPKTDGPALSGARSAIVEGRIATFQLHWEDPDTHTVTKIAPLPALGNFNTWDLAQSFEQADPRFQ